jgi:glutathione peroxidase
MTSARCLLNVSQLHFVSIAGWFRRRRLARDVSGKEARTGFVVRSRPATTLASRRRSRSIRRTLDRTMGRARFRAMSTLHNFQIRSIDGASRSLSELSGKTVLVVNVASQCGLTPQYAGLEELQKKYESRGFTVLGFPCNQFAGQEPGAEAEIAAFCSTTYGVTFPLSAKVEVNGEGRDPLYAWLTGENTAPDGPGDIKWNFAKFLIGRDGRIVARYGPMVTPDDAGLVADIEAALA